MPCCVYIAWKIGTMETGNAKRWAFINLVAFAAVIAVNALAVLLPINGMDTGRISGLYPNLFVPAGFTFSIWSVIYLLLLSFCIYALVAPSPVIRSIAPLFFFSCLLNISWILLWHYLQISLSVLVMLAFLCTLVLITEKIRHSSAGFSTLQKLAIGVPFSVYLGWISVATVANITAFLVHVDWNGFGLDPALWSVVMIITAALLGIFFLFSRQDLAYGLVISWALFGIYSNQHSVSQLVGNAAMAALVVLLAGWLFTAFRSTRMKRA